MFYSLILIFLSSFSTFIVLQSMKKSNNKKKESKHTKWCQSGGSVAMVGSGPGAPELMTIEALEYMESCDVVIADYLIHSDILSLIPKHVITRISNKKQKKQAAGQEELNKWVIDYLNQGKKVVRLKIGDPSIYGRCGEELQFYRSIGYEPILVGGLSSAFSAPLQAKIPLTLRGVADQITVTTGMGENNTITTIPTYRHKTTLVLLMGTERLKTFVQDFSAANYPLDVPVAVIENSSLSNERIFYGTIETIVETSKQEKIKAPAVIIVGHVVSFRTPNFINAQRKAI